jgi:hypothetical protein
MRLALLTVGQVAKRVGGITGRKPSASTVVRWIARGTHGRRLPATRQGGIWLVDARDVDDFIQQVNVSPQSAAAVDQAAIVDAELTAMLGPSWSRKSPN